MCVVSYILFLVTPTLLTEAIMTADTYTKKLFLKECQTSCSE